MITISSRLQAALDVHDAAVKVHTTGSAGTLWWKLVTKVFIGGESPVSNVSLWV